MMKLGKATPSQRARPLGLMNLERRNARPQPKLWPFPERMTHSNP
jgi:hypothetical protein